MSKPPWDPTTRPDIAILIALPEEFRTLARDYARQWHKQPNPKYPGSDFLFVGPNGYRCVASIMPRMGPTVAAQTSMRLLDWRPAAIVNIGIAGGFKDDLRIGDVIVPRQVDAYDETGKIKGTQWERRGSDYRPSATILSDVLEFEFEGDAHAKWVAEAAADLAKLSVDDQAKIDGLIDRKLLRKQPTISTSHLASGSFVVASKLFAEFLREANADIHAGEMEAAGMMAAAEYQRESVSTLVVRGISDHVDADKKEVDSIGDGALRRLAMANAWRLVCLLMELGKLPSSPSEPAGASTQARGATPTKAGETKAKRLADLLGTIYVADKDAVFGLLGHRARLASLCQTIAKDGAPHIYFFAVAQKVSSHPTLAQEFRLALREANEVWHAEIDAVLGADAS